MLPPGSLDRIHVAFDDHRLVANADLLLPVTLAYRLGMGELVDHRVALTRLWFDGARPPAWGRLTPSKQHLSTVPVRKERIGHRQPLTETGA